MLIARLLKRIAGSALLAISLLCVSPVSAHPLYLFGNIGRFPVLVMITREKNDLSGWYLYLSHAKEIAIAGRIDAAGAFTFDEFDPKTHAKIARFAGTMKLGQWNGTWQKTAGGARLPFSVWESRDALPDLDGQVHCATKMTDASAGYTFRNALDLKARHGQLSTFSLNSSAKGWGDEQSCSLDLTEMHRAQSDAGILLQTRKTSPAAGSDLHQCSIRIVGNADYLFVAVGDADEDGNDCHGDTDMMYCSARGSWTDLVVERKTDTCRAVQ
jgi:hypothetical protein